MILVIYLFGSFGVPLLLSAQEYEYAFCHSLPHFYVFHHLFSESAAALLWAFHLHPM